MTSSFFWASPCTLSHQPAQHAGEGALGNIDGNGLDRTGDDFHQQAQIGAHQAFALLLDQNCRARLDA